MNFPFANLLEEFESDKNNFLEDTCEKHIVEKDLTNLINEYAKSEKTADIVIKKLGLNMNESMNFETIGKLYNQSDSNMALLFNKEIKRLKENELFKYKLKLLTQDGLL